MPNQIANVQSIARAVLPCLSDQLVFPNLCYKDFEDKTQVVGDTILIRRPPKLIAQDFTQGSASSAQDVIQNNAAIKLDKIATIDVQFEALERANSISDVEKLIGEPAGIALAEKINTAGLLLYRQVPTLIGTPGTTPSTVAAFANARKQLNKQKAPAALRRAVWDPEADGEFSKIEKLLSVSDSGSSAALREGAIGRVSGIDNFMSQGVATHTQGTAISGNKTIVIAAAASKGDTQISVDSAAAAGTLKVGDILKIGDYQYNVAEDVAAIGTTAATVKLAQPLQADVADDAAITLPTYVSGKTGYTCNLAFQQNAFAFVTRPLAMAPGVESYTTSYGGVSLRVTRGYDMSYKRERMTVDVLYGYVCCYPELAVVHAG